MKTLDDALSYIKENTGEILRRSQAGERTAQSVVMLFEEHRGHPHDPQTVGEFLAAVEKYKDEVNLEHAKAPL